MIATTLSSCFSVSKMTYLEPVGNNKQDWVHSQTPDGLYSGFYNFFLERSVKNNTGKQLGVIILKFNFWQGSRFIFDLAIKAESQELFRKIDLDSLGSNNILDSLKRKGIGPGQGLPYKKFSLQNKSDNITITAKLSEYFMGYTNRFSSYPQLKKGQQIKITTGAPYLDSIFNQYTFEVKTKTKVGFMTHMN
ncbi:MAG: hypothetical protein JWR50_3835 [Mucilaginibacter sp.]|nr:hypothetical protein [Mucilaginibacter sp.]